MNYYYDTEFLEGAQKKWFGNTKPTIDLISIGIVSEDNREYYAISKDFNLKEAWDRHDLEIQSGDMRNLYPEGKKVYWIRENVLNPIFMELQQLEREYLEKQKRIIGYAPCINSEWSYSNFKRLIKKHGKTNKEIAEGIKSFCEKTKFEENEDGRYIIGTDISNATKKGNIVWDKPNFYAYYADYDWVAFCWLFGKMIDLPKGFPMYSKDLKQILDDKVSVFCAKEIQDTSFESAVKRIKMHKDYPKQTNEHNALADAKWNKDLHNFLNNL